MSTRDVLTNIPMFQSLTAEDIHLLTPLWHQRILKKSEVLFRKGDAGHCRTLIRPA